MPNISVIFDASTLSCSEFNDANAHYQRLCDESKTSVNTTVDTAVTTEVDADIKSVPTIRVTHFVDGRGLACPMPLLKLKVALRSVAVGDSVYVIATDSNSLLDIKAFCKHTQSSDLPLNLTLAETTKPLADDLEKLDTIFHLIITKTHGK